jgi:hypothetical protein
VLARGCACARPRVFADQPDTCHRCGHAAPAAVSASTWKLALAIAEIKYGLRKGGSGYGRE